MPANRPNSGSTLNPPVNTVVGRASEEEEEDDIRH